MGRMVGGLLLVLVLCQAAWSSTVLRFGPDDLTDRANVIFHGKCTDKQARQRDDGAIVTDYQFTVYEFLKGARGKTFTFTGYGGVLGERGTAVAGAPTFAQDEEILVFLDKINRQGCRAVIGLAQGKYTIRVEKGKKLAFRDLEGLRLMDPKTRAVSKPQPEQGVPFTDLLSRVKKRLAKASGSKE